LFLPVELGGIPASTLRCYVAAGTERTGEVGLARKLEGQRNMGQRLVPLPEQLFGESSSRITIGNTTARCVIIGEPAGQFLRSEQKLQMILPAP
jgi:hypothetical protein